METPGQDPGAASTVEAGADEVREARRDMTVELYTQDCTLTLDDVVEQLRAEGIRSSRSQAGRDLEARGIARRPGGARRKHPKQEPRECEECTAIFTPTAAEVAKGRGRFC